MDKNPADKSPVSKPQADKTPGKNEGRRSKTQLENWAFLDKVDKTPVLSNSVFI